MTTRTLHLNYYFNGQWSTVNGQSNYPTDGNLKENLDSQQSILTVNQYGPQYTITTFSQCPRLRPTRIRPHFPPAKMLRQMEAGLCSARNEMHQSTASSPSSRTPKNFIITGPQTDSQQNHHNRTRYAAAQQRL